MNNFNPNNNILNNGDGNNDLFASQTQMWHSYANRLIKPNSHQNFAGNDFNGALDPDFIKYLPRHHLSSLNNYAGPSNDVNNFPFQAERNDGPIFQPPVRRLNDPTFPVQSFNANNEQFRASFNHPVSNEPPRNINNFHRNFPVQLLPVTDNKNIPASTSDFHNFFINNQNEKVVKSPINGNDVRVLTYTRDEYDRNNGKNFNCNFCKRLGKPK